MVLKESQKTFVKDVEYNLDTLLVHWAHPHNTHFHIYTYGQFRASAWPSWRFFQLWEVESIPPLSYLLFTQSYCRGLLVPISSTHRRKERVHPGQVTVPLQDVEYTSKHTFLNMKMNIWNILARGIYTSLCIFHRIYYPLWPIYVNYCLYITYNMLQYVNNKQWL